MIPPLSPDPELFAATVKFPDCLVGSLCLVEYDQDREGWMLYVDDQDTSTYFLGSQVQGIVNSFRAWGFPKREAESLLDLAREFGRAVMVFEDLRVYPFLGSRESPVLEFSDEQEQRYHEFPALRTSG